MTSMKRNVLTAACGLLAAALVGGVLGSAAAQQATSSRMDGLAISGDKPIQIESDQLQVKDQDGTAIFTGNVKVVQGETLLQSGVMTVYYEKQEPAQGQRSGDGAQGQQSAEGGGQAPASPTSGLGSNIERIDVADTVYIQSGEQTATADRGIFNMKTEVLELTGERVVLTEGNNVLVGCKLTVFMKSGEAKLDGCGGGNGRVKMQLDPKAKDSSRPEGGERRRKTN
ncbi:LPS ABC transporter substrate-binding protein LptA [Hoeflea sp. WL0058]|uniref:LPS ABC transporter substrate-binding protein LptA n=2 Tax=Flavimaribacter sediminis TaxID=2865987 RepID=A0AAE2ZKZ0_9HYPH|nr:LPS ABC transporter substrate-binding protein LptA [Flavimaribacter sediminis]